MNHFDKINYVYFLGVGGIGMSALARYFNFCGKKVFGYDLTASPLTLKLEQEGISVVYSDDVSLIPKECLAYKDQTMVVFTPAVPQDNKIFGYFAVNRFFMLKRARVLGMISDNYSLIAVAGTHGKTTTSSVIANILRCNSRNSFAFLGGISKNLDSNLMLPENKEAFDDKKSLRTLLKAIALYNQDKFKKSILLLQSIRGGCKTTGEKYCVELFLALNYTDGGDNGTAIDIYENMSRRGIADSRMYSNLANLYTDEGDFEKACESARSAVTFDPKNYSAYNNLAYSSFRSGDYESAKKAAEDCLKIKGDFLPSIKLLYIIHSLNGNHDEAENYARKAIANGLSKKELQETLEYYIGDE